MLHHAPKGYTKLDVTPCMSFRRADSLIEIVDKAKPGRITFTSGKVHLRIKVKVEVMNHFF